MEAGTLSIELPMMRKKGVADYSSELSTVR